MASLSLKCSCVCLTLFFLGISLKTHCQRSLPIKLNVIDQQTQQPVVFARVINKNRRAGATTDSLGVFSIAAQRSDTLLISTIGYEPERLIITDAFLLEFRHVPISLKRHVYELNPIELTGLPTYLQFKQKVLQDVLPNPMAVMPTERNVIVPIIEHAPPQPEAGIGGPITRLYMAFSKEGKAHKSYVKAKEHRIKETSITPKYNRAIVSRITGLYGNVLDEFIAFCQPSESFLLSASEYDVCVETFRCLDKFIEARK